MSRIITLDANRATSLAGIGRATDTRYVVTENVTTHPGRLTLSPYVAPPAPVPTGVNKSRPFSDASAWNTFCSKYTADHELLHRDGNGNQRHAWLSIQALKAYWSSPNDPFWTFNLPAYITPNANRNWQASTFTMRAPEDISSGTDDDHILWVGDPVTGDYVEVWLARIDRATHTVTGDAAQPGWARGNCITGTGMGGTTNAGVRAANSSWLAGLMTGPEILNGRFDHALAVALPWDLMKGGGWTGAGAYIAPATAWDWSGRTGLLPMGTRLGIPFSTPKPQLSNWGNAIWDALVTYGAFCMDFTGGPSPMFYADGNSVAGLFSPELSGTPFDAWSAGKAHEMDLIINAWRIV